MFALACTLFANPCATSSGSLISPQAQETNKQLEQALKAVEDEMIALKTHVLRSKKASQLAGDGQHPAVNGSPCAEPASSPSLSSCEGTPHTGMGPGLSEPVCTI